MGGEGGEGGGMGGGWGGHGGEGGEGGGGGGEDGNIMCHSETGIVWEDKTLLENYSAKN